MGLGVGQDKVDRRTKRILRRVKASQHNGGKVFSNFSLGQIGGGCPFHDLDHHVPPRVLGPELPTPLAIEVNREEKWNLLINQTHACIFGPSSDTLAKESAQKPLDHRGHT